MSYSKGRMGKSMDKDVVEDIIKRMMKTLNVDTQQQLADYLGRESAGITQWKTRGKIPLTVLSDFSKSQKVSIDWLMTGVHVFPEGKPNLLTDSDLEYFPAAVEVVKAIKMKNYPLLKKILEYALGEVDRLMEEQRQSK